MKALLTATVSVLPLWACAARSGELIDGYRAGTCVSPVAQSKPVQASTRQWDVTVRVPGGTPVQVAARYGVGGHVSVKEVTTGAAHVAVSSADYIYPADLRLSPDRTRLFVKTDGLAGGLWSETWLTEYDLRQFTQVRRSRVKAEVLPAECPIPFSTGP